MLSLQNEVNELAYLIDRAYEKKMVITLNPSPFNEKLDNCDLNKISLFFINEIEGQQITHQSRIDEILNGMRQKYPRGKCGADIRLGRNLRISGKEYPFASADI